MAELLVKGRVTRSLCPNRLGACSPPWFSPQGWQSFHLTKCSKNRDVESERAVSWRRKDTLQKKKLDSLLRSNFWPKQWDAKKLRGRKKWSACTSQLCALHLTCMLCFSWGLISGLVCSEHKLYQESSHTPAPHSVLRASLLKLEGD